MWDIHFGHSGTVRRDFTKSQKKSGASFEPLDLADIVKLLNKNQATLREQYELKTYRRKIRENALVACITLTGARVSEILGVRKNKEYVTPPLRLSQLRLEHEEVTDKDVIVFKDITCLKHKPRVRYDTDGNPIPFVPQRELWYPYDGVFKELYLFIDKHIEVMKQVGLKEADPPIFNLSRSVVNLYLNRIFGNNLEQLGINTLTNRKEMIAYPHWLRHSNLTYMADKFKLSDSQIRAYTGWSTPAMAAKYVHLKPKNLYQSMMQEK
jgi:integrase